MTQVCWKPESTKFICASDELGVCVIFIIKG